MYYTVIISFSFFSNRVKRLLAARLEQTSVCDQAPPFVKGRGWGGNVNIYFFLVRGCMVVAVCISLAKGIVKQKSLGKFICRRGYSLIIYCLSSKQTATYYTVIISFSFFSKRVKRLLAARLEQTCVCDQAPPFVKGRGWGGNVNIYFFFTRMYGGSGLHKPCQRHS